MGQSYSLTMIASFMLNNPIWHALSTTHSRFAVGDSLARRYPDDVAPLGGMVDQLAASYESLARILPGGTIALFLDEAPAPPENWKLEHHAEMYQMMYDASLAIDGKLPFQTLTPSDVPAMLDLVKQTEPGPFRQRTIELGTYLGIFDSGSLAAMAGERLKLTGFTEISAVCAHPRFRGRGYAAALVLAIVRCIADRGEAPFLHVRSGNTPAVRLYEKLGFKIHSVLQLAVVRNLDRAARAGVN